MSDYQMMAQEIKRLHAVCREYKKELMDASNIRKLWVESGNWEGKHFVQLFGETRGMDLWRKFDADNVLGFLCKECQDEEIEALLNFKRT